MILHPDVWERAVIGCVFAVIYAVGSVALSLPTSGLLYLLGALR